MLTPEIIMEARKYFREESVKLGVSDRDYYIVSDILWDLAAHLEEEDSAE